MLCSFQLIYYLVLSETEKTKSFTIEKYGVEKMC